jgi:hypothetical protein
MQEVIIKKPEQLRRALLCTATEYVRNDGSLALYGKGVIVGMVQCLMAQGATYERAWAIIKAHLPENTSKQCLPKDWTLA